MADIRKGFSGTCTAALHALLWENGVATDLSSLGGSTNNVALAINNESQVVGQSGVADDTTFHAFLWQKGAITDLGTVSGDFASFASGVNNKGQVVGTSLDGNFNLAHAFLWENGVMTDLNTLFPAGFHLYPTMANKINSRGQISGMATDLNDGTIHAFLATPADRAESDTVARQKETRATPKVTLPENVRRMLLRGLGFRGIRAER